MALTALLLLQACAPEVDTERHRKSKARSPSSHTQGSPDCRQVGIASWYGPGFDGKATASGDTFDQDELTAAHRTLPLGTEVDVTDLRSGKSVEVEINDRGPYVGNRAIDLSSKAAKKLGIKEKGKAKVRIEADDVPGKKVEGTVSCADSKISGKNSAQ
ncbi:septal ring lytic transglycosylase RlpA family protein [Methyloterricola oryzae]|uniref:septal ring lytic transglycosylase RlpA family protein n=1 Tax=Methyloterricola oryzae TaxID=1495050 RepID=UPI001F4539F1|nr:septal ring lytic transglycosylase RlpA family protein [Methyloterricola oryzae]